MTQPAFYILFIGTIFSVACNNNVKTTTVTKIKESSFNLKRYGELPKVDQGWIEIADHFIATVGKNSGHGEGLKNLIVLADAKVKPHSVFPEHPHRNMEILTWVARGTLEHKDNQGLSQTVPEAHMQLMSTRDGIVHAEGNSTNKTLRILQIWIKPSQTGGGPPIVKVAGVNKRGFNLLAGPNNAPLRLKQETWIYAAKLDGTPHRISIPETKFAYVISIGSLVWNEKKLKDGDGALAQSGDVVVDGYGQAVVIMQNK